MKEAKMIKEIPLASAKDGAITVATVKEPYSKGTAPVVSVGIWLSMLDLNRVFNVFKGKNHKFTSSSTVVLVLVVVLVVVELEAD